MEQDPEYSVKLQQEGIPPHTVNKSWIRLKKPQVGLDGGAGEVICLNKVLGS